MIRRDFLLFLGALFVGATTCVADDLSEPSPLALGRVSNCREAITQALASPYGRRSPCSSPAGPDTKCQAGCAAAPGGWSVTILAGGPEHPYHCRLYIGFDQYVQGLLPCGSRK